MTLNNFPLVSIITVNYNGSEVTSALLKSIQKLTYPNFEVIVVDNASSINPTQTYLANLSKTQVIVSEINLGFAGGNNLGIKNAKGDFLFFVNNDTELDPGIIEPLILVFSTQVNPGIVCPKFHYFYHPGVIEYAGYGKMNFFTARNRMIGNQQKDIGQYNKLNETHYAHGGGMMVPRKVIEDVGGLPECYFLYYEEMDWCEQIKKRGYKIYYQPAALIHHKESVTTGKESSLKTYYLTRNRILFMKRNASVFQWITFLTYFTLFTIPKNLLSFYLKGDSKHLTAFCDGIRWHFSKAKNLIYTK